MLDVGISAIFEPFTVDMEVDTERLVIAPRVVLHHLPVSVEENRDVFGISKQIIKRIIIIYSFITIIIML